MESQCNINVSPGIASEEGNESSVLGDFEKNGVCDLLS